MSNVFVSAQPSLFLQLLPLLIALFVSLIPAIICGKFCEKLAARKRLPHRYFWTGFFCGILGLVYIGFLPAETMGDV